VLRFLYLTDTHFGAEPGAGWMLQPRCPAELLEPLIDGLARWLATSDVDFVLHGGDVIEAGRADQIALAMGLLRRLGKPVRVCLGNHDLLEADSMARWRTADGFLPSGQPNYVIQRPEAVIVVIAHHWNAIDPPYQWALDGPQVPVIDATQMDMLVRAIKRAEAPGRPAILLLHSPVVRFPHDGSRPDPMIEPHNTELLDALLALAHRYASLRVLLAGHSHVNRIAKVRDLTVVATAAFGESPFEARLVSVDDGGIITIETPCFAELLGFDVPYDRERSFAQGDPSDRECILR